MKIYRSVFPHLRSVDVLKVTKLTYFSIHVSRLLTKKTYEMQMFHMSSLKMGLDQAVLNGFENGSSGEVRNSFRAIFVDRFHM